MSETLSGVAAGRVGAERSSDEAGEGGSGVTAGRVRAGRSSDGPGEEGSEDVPDGGLQIHSARIAFREYLVCVAMLFHAALLENTLPPKKKFW